MGRFRPGTRCLLMQKPRVHTAECLQLLEAAGQSSRTRLATYSLRLPPRQTAYPSIRENPSDFDALKSIIKIVHI